MKKGFGILLIVIGIIGPFTQKFDMVTIIISILFVIGGMLMVKLTSKQISDNNKKPAPSKQTTPKKKKEYSQTAKLVTTGKERQSNLEQYGNMNLPMKSALDITNHGNLYVSFGFMVGDNRTFFKEIGKLQDGLTKQLQQQYEKTNGLSCNINVLNYTISKDDKGLYQCVVDIEIISE